MQLTCTLAWKFLLKVPKLWTRYKLTPFMAVKDCVIQTVGKLFKIKAKRGIMKLKVYILLPLLFLCVNFTYSQEPEWLQNMKKILPLKSTQNDVIKIFGMPTKAGDPYSPEYVLREGRLFVRYSKGFCRQNQKLGWNVEEFTVTEITFNPQKPFKPSKYQISLDGFSVFHQDDVPNAASYENKELGISYFLTSKGTIDNVKFFPSNKYQNLHCKELDK